MAVAKKRIGRPPKPEAERAQTFGVRMVPALREKLVESAEANGRSLNAEITYRLRESLTATPWSLRQTQLLADLEDVLFRVFQFYPSAKPERSTPVVGEEMTFWATMEELEYLNRQLQRGPSLGDRYPKLLDPSKNTPGSEPTKK